MDYRSNHPPPVFKSIAYSQALRVKMICSEEAFAENQLRNLKEKFLKRNYPEQLIDEQFSKAMARDRADLLRPKTYPHDAAPVQQARWRGKTLVTPFIVTYNRFNPPLQKWLEEEFYLLQMDERNRKVFPHRPNVVHRQPPNIKRQLVRAKQNFQELPYDGQNENTQEPGCTKCQSNRCVTCNVTKESKYFQSSLLPTIGLILPCRNG